VTAVNKNIVYLFFRKKVSIKYKKMKYKPPFIENEYIFWDVPKEKINMNIGTEGVVNLQF
jgi:hypothetical protein